MGDVTSATTCHKCGDEAEPGKKACRVCLDKNARQQRLRRKRARKKGLCGTCAVRKAVPGKSHCEKCGARNLSDTRNRAKKRVENGLCRQCGSERNEEGRCTGCRFNICDWCNDREVTHPKARMCNVCRAKPLKVRLIEAGKCVQCGRKEPEDNGVTCRGCRDKRQIRRAS